MSVEQIFFQAGMVGAFCIFTILMTRLNSNERKTRDEQNGSERKTRDEQWRQFIAEQNAMMVSFLDRERDQRKEIMTNAYRDFGGNMDRIATGLGELTKAMAMHDANAQTRHEKILGAIRTINGRSNPKE